MSIERTPEQLRAHYEIEKELATRLREASREDRLVLYRSVYDELFRRVPQHPQVTRKASAAEQAKLVTSQINLLLPLLSPEATFLEIGAGDCSLSLEIAKRVKRVYAVDVSEEIAPCEGTPDNFKLIISDGTSIPVTPGTVNVAYSAHLIEHLHPDDALEQTRNVYNALAPNGYYVCITPYALSGPHDISRFFDDTPTGLHLKEYSIGELVALFKQTGFSKVQVLLSVKGRRLTSLLPSSPFTALEAFLGRLPRSWHKKPAALLLSVKVVARK